MFALLAGVSLLAARTAAQQSAVASIVERFYPPSLVASADGGGREQCFAVYEADASGAPRTIVAAYTNHVDAVIRVLRANAGSFDVIAEPQGLDLTGVWCSIQQEDIDGDGRREIRIDFSVNRSTASWLFRWDGQRLVNLTPTTTGVSGDRATQFIDGDLLDADGDGVKEIYVRPAYSGDPAEPVPPAMLYRLRGDQYVEDMRLVGAWMFERKTTVSETTNVAVDLPQGARGPYRLRILNGGAGGTTRAALVQVWINQRVVVTSPEADGQRIVERAVTLRRTNALAVRFAGRPRGELLILIESDRWDVP